MVAAGPDQQPVLDAGTAVTVTQAAGGWDVTMGTAVGRLELGCGEGAWVESRLRGQERASSEPRGRHARESLPVVARGAWTDAHTFEADIVLIEQPHRLRLHCRDGVATLAWNAEPLSGTRLEAHLP